jgi:hypothetical protein
MTSYAPYALNAASSPLLYAGYPSDTGQPAAEMVGDDQITGALETYNRRSVKDRAMSDRMGCGWSSTHLRVSARGGLHTVTVIVGRGCRDRDDILCAAAKLVGRRRCHVRILSLF